MGETIMGVVLKRVKRRAAGSAVALITPSLFSQFWAKRAIRGSIARF